MTHTTCPPGQGYSSTSAGGAPGRSHVKRWSMYMQAAESTKPQQEPSPPRHVAYESTCNAGFALQIVRGLRSDRCLSERWCLYSMCCRRYKQLPGAVKQSDVNEHLQPRVWIQQCLRNQRTHRINNNDGTCTQCPVGSMSGEKVSTLCDRYEHNHVSSWSRVLERLCRLGFDWSL